MSGLAILRLDSWLLVSRECLQVQHELAGLLHHRNRLAAHMAPQGCGPRGAAGTASSREAPPMLQESFACERCPLAETCAVYHKVRANPQ